MDRRWIGSWLSGPRAAGVGQPDALGYAGERLGLPETGPGAAAPVGRRLGALLLDWVACVAIVRGLLDVDASTTLGVLAVPGLLALEYLLLLPTTGFTLGMRITRVRVARVAGADEGPPGLASVVVRTALLLLVIPAVVYDRDRRGLHDKAAGTVVLRD
ncbi:MAG: RDD family protein [Actinomycetes bacterium]